MRESRNRRTDCEQKGLYPIVLEHESNGTVSAYVIGLPGVFAAADTERAAGPAIRKALRAHVAALKSLPTPPKQMRTPNLKSVLSDLARCSVVAGAPRRRQPRVRVDAKAAALAPWRSEMPGLPIQSHRRDRH